MRQIEVVVRGYAVTHPAGDVQLPTQPGWDQIIYASSGVFVAGTDRETWTVPPHRAMCVGDGTPLQLTTRKPVVFRGLYLRTHLGAVSEPIRVINVSALTRELLLHAVELCPLDLSSPVESALITLLIDRLSSHRTAALRLPLPVDRRATLLAGALIADPATTLGMAIGDVAASRRTLERLFLSETGMTLAGWQRRARVLAAIELMAAGETVTTAAISVGYATPSSFVAAFRSELGETPRAFMKVSGVRPHET